MNLIDEIIKETESVDNDVIKAWGKLLDECQEEKKNKLKQTYSIKEKSMFANSDPHYYGMRG